MKYLITILLFISFNAKATVYYIATAGNDGAAGTSTGTAWATIAKVNASSFLPGDQILFNKGDTWNERLIPPSSGNLANPIIIGSYGTGSKPIITGLQTQGGFTNVGNVYSATATNSVASLNTVLVNGLLSAKARTPNTGWSTFSSYSGNTQITTALTGTPNYTGSELVVRTAHWVIDVTKITSQSTGVLNFSPGITYTPSFGGNGYFIQNTISDLDIAGEWQYDSTTKVLKVYSSGSPNVQISTIDTLVWLRHKDYITFDGISFKGANKAAFQLDTASHITIQNCSINYSGTLAISGIKSLKTTIQNDSIQNSLSGAIYLRQVDPYTPTVNTCDSALVDGNYIKNAAHLAGMGMNNNGRYNGISVIGLSPVITNNRIDSTGYIAIVWGGTNAVIKNNYINTYCFVKDDGAGIYTVIGNYLTANYNDGGIVRANIILNGTGALAGTTGEQLSAGIYLDNSTKLITVDSNTVSNAIMGGISFNGANTISVRHNTVVNSIGTGLSIFYGNSVSGFNVKRNVLYSQNSAQPVLYMANTDFTETIDSNYYLRPVLETSKLKMASTTYSLPAWVAATGYDANSQSTPTGITGADPLFYINPTLNDSLFLLSGTYQDARNTVYINSITLAPFTSVLLFKSVTNIYTRRFLNRRFQLRTL